VFPVIITSDQHTYSIAQHLKSLTPNKYNIVATYPIGASNQT